MTKAELEQHRELGRARMADFRTNGLKRRSAVTCKAETGTSLKEAPPTHHFVVCLQSQISNLRVPIHFTISGSLCEKNALCFVSRVAIFSISSWLNSKSKTVKFSMMRSL
ncbi:hypothetical protein SAMN04489725_11059 [Alicyclobacillus hesperidum]|uniref:Uncharacterized protein n=1 Tax=Alicyclobacillus hesperidum TaxID=89784 RepID=A0A1H2VA29_9BACL|nr:hypothetical protein SAMN04489725_11059 [Alicyclobacillus hesperidum]